MDYENCKTECTQENRITVTEKLNKIYDRLEELNRCSEDIKTKLIGPYPVNGEKNGAPNPLGVESYIELIKNDIEKLTNTLFFISERL